MATTPRAKTLPTELTKEQRVDKEYRRIKSVLRDLDANKKKTVDSLMRNAAFMSICLVELQEEINENGFTEEYKNGKEQWGTKQSEAVKTHIAMTRNHAAIMKILADLTPAARTKKTPLQKLMES